MAYYVKYDNTNRKAADRLAIADIQSYCSPKAWTTLLELVQTPSCSIEQLNMAFSFAGVSGYPFHAMMRKYRLAQYIAWMTSGDDAVEVDDEGYSLIKRDSVQS